MKHEFLNAIGFSSYTKTEEIEKLLASVVTEADEQLITEDLSGNPIASYTRYFGRSFGLRVCGSFLEDNENTFVRDHYFPFYRSLAVTTYEQVELEADPSRLSFSGLCDDMRLGVTMIFSVQNPMRIFAQRKAFGNEFSAANAAISGLALAGRILLPVEKTPEHQHEKSRLSKRRMHLMEKAREGNQTAIDSLTINEMDTFSMISRRVENEDVFSIVESSFIPYGVYSDQYIVLGEIVYQVSQLNRYTGEKIWILTVNCNDLIFDICINDRDLYGVPEVGRRLRARIWLQGNINFTS